MSNFKNRTVFKAQLTDCKYVVYHIQKSKQSRRGLFAKIHCLVFKQESTRRLFTHHNSHRLSGRFLPYQCHLWSRFCSHNNPLVSSKNVSKCPWLFVHNSFVSNTIRLICRILNEAFPSNVSKGFRTSSYEVNNSTSCQNIRHCKTSAI